MLDWNLLADYDPSQESVGNAACILLGYSLLLLGLIDGHYFCCCLDRNIANPRLKRR